MSNYFRGSKYQKGYGLGGCFAKKQRGNGLGRYNDGSSQKGYGLGGMWGKFIHWVTPLFKKVKDYALPLLKSGSKQVGKEIINSVSDIAKSVLDGEKLSKVSQQRLSTGIDNLIGPKEKIMPEIVDDEGMVGEGLKTKRRKIFGSFRKKLKKSRKLDIFDN